MAKKVVNVPFSTPVLAGAALLTSQASISIDHPVYDWVGDVSFDFFPPIIVVFVLVLAAAVWLAPRIREFLATPRVSTEDRKRAIRGTSPCALATYLDGSGPPGRRRRSGSRCGG